MAIEYVPYQPEPLSGQALLNNFTRTRRLLRYRGSDGALRSVERGMPLYEITFDERVGEAELPDFTFAPNLLIRGECLSACAWLKKRIVAGEQRPIDLVYIDPPFASEANYAKQVYLRRNPLKPNGAGASEAQLAGDGGRSFEETMYGDIWDKESYLNWMYENLCAIKSVMARDASIYVHLDYHIGAYVKVLLDEVFGEDCFRNEIVWQRANAHSDAKQGAAHYGRMHDVIYYYALTDGSTFNQQYVPYDQEFIDRYYSNVEPETGRRYWLDNIQGPGGSAKGNPYYEVMGVSRYWRYSRETMDKLIAEGRIVQTSPGSVPKYKRYLDEMPGKPVQDLWSDIKSLGGLGTKVNERVDYATQKPEALLERIVRASSDEGMLVADFFGGSGTTAAVAAKSGRNFIHVDVGINSIQTARRRLRAVPGLTFDVLRVQDGVSLYRNPQQTQEKLFDLIPGLVKDPLLSDGYWAGAVHSPKDGMVPVHLPNLLDSSTKLFDEAQATRALNEKIPFVPDEVRKVVIYYVDSLPLEGPEGLLKFIDDHNDIDVEVELRDLKPLLAQAVDDDGFSFEVTSDGDSLIEGMRTSITRYYSPRLANRIDELNMKGALKKRPAKPIALSEEGLELVELVSLDCTASEGPWHADAEVYIDRDGRVERNGVPTGAVWDGSVCSDRAPLRVKVRNISGDECVRVVAEGEGA